MNIVFDFDVLTIGDWVRLIQAIKGDDLASFLVVADTCAVGGVYHLPVSEMPRVCEQFAIALKAYKTQLENPTTPDMPEAVRLLKQVFGDSQE
jgi:hypothetical protein